jgi:hypothetical protein
MLTPERAARLRALWHASPSVTVSHMARVIGVAPCTIYDWRARLQLGDRRPSRHEPVPVLRRCPHCMGRISGSVAHHCEGAR